MGVPSIGIGASAGGLEALREFVSAIRPDSGFCYVIIQHFAPDHTSLLDKILQESCAVPVTMILPGDKLLPNRVYVNPPGKLVTLDEEDFVLEEQPRVAGLRTPINQFFVSLANSLGSDAYAVVLSGTGTDGTSGVREIKSVGGVVVAQKSQTAKFAGMPDSVISKGLTDFVLPPADIPGSLLDLRQSKEAGLSPALENNGRERIEQALPEIVQLLTDAGLSDFSGYKTGTLSRRVLRRMGLMRKATLKSYLELLRESNDERISLSQDFLVGVTRFFRDPDGYAALREHVLPQLLDRQQDHLRIWVPGCSTGEEVYSLAFMIQSMIEEKRSSMTFQIFGTDVDMEALKTARGGIYTKEALAEVSDDDVARFFNETQQSYQVKLGVRESCLFAPHNLLHDPPFSRIDLISCKNLLIYLNEQAQAAIIPRFHYALNPESFLALGPSESTSYGEEMFHALDRRHRIYKRNDSAVERFSALRTNPALSRGDLRTQHFMPDKFGANAHSTSLEGLIERQYVQVAA